MEKTELLLTEKRSKSRPIKMVLIYLIATQLAYLLFQEDDLNSKFIVIIYTALNYSMLGLGYFMVIRKKKFIYKETNISSKSINRVIMFCSLMTIIININTIMAYYENFSQIFYYLIKPGEAYEHVKFLSRHDRTFDSLVKSDTLLKSVVGVALSSLTFTKYYLFTFTILYWNTLKKNIKIIGVLAMIFYFVQSLLVGAMINIAVIFFSLIPLFLSPEKSINRINRSKVLMLGITLTIVLSYFLGSRNVFQTNYSGRFQVLVSGFMGLTSYISHGYVGLSKALKLPFAYTYGQTTIRGLALKILPILGINDLFHNSYLMRNQQVSGWPALQRWSTIFPWLASDFTFLLIPVIMLFIGILFKVTWKESIYCKNPYAMVLTGQIFIFVFMIPANNFLFHTYTNAFSTLLIVLLYINSKRLTKIRKN